MIASGVIRTRECCIVGLTSRQLRLPRRIQPGGHSTESRVQTRTPDTEAVANSVPSGLKHT